MNLFKRSEYLFWRTISTKESAPYYASQPCEPRVAQPRGAYRTVLCVPTSTRFRMAARTCELFSPIRAKQDPYLTHAATIFVDVGFFLYYSLVLIVRYFLTYSVRMAARVSSTKAQSKIRLVDRPCCRHKEGMLFLGCFISGDVISWGVISGGVISGDVISGGVISGGCLLYTSPSPRDRG